MTDREKALKGLECCSGENKKLCLECPYNAQDDQCAMRMAKGALELLKEQPQWASAKDRPPERPDWYQVYAPDYRGGSSRGKELHKGVTFSKWNGESWSIEKGYYNRPSIVLAWREIPDTPKEAKQDET